MGETPEDLAIGLVKRRLALSAFETAREYQLLSAYCGNRPQGRNAKGQHDFGASLTRTETPPNTEY